MTSADKCRQMGWGPGTVLRGDEGDGPEDIVITAVGEVEILAVYDDEESQWSLSLRDWRQVGDHGRLWHGPGDDQ